MGGPAGHMKHPFDLPHVKTGEDLIKEFEKIKDFLKEGAAAIKIDGVNTSFKLVDAPEGKQFSADRGSTKQIDIDGITLDNLSERFPEGHGMRGAITTLLKIFNEALQTANIKQELQVLGVWDLSLIHISEPTRPY